MIDLCIFNYDFQNVCFHFVVSRYLIIGGITESQNILTEVVELVNTDSTPSYGQLPDTQIGAVGGMLGNAPILCGGIDFRIIFSDYCMYFQNSQWVLSHTMNEYRAGSIGIQINSTTLWILGGTYGIGNTMTNLDSSEFIILGQNKGVLGPKLPDKIQTGCAVKLSERAIFVIGGLIQNTITTILSPRKDVWIYDPQNGFARKKGPSLNIARAGHSCSTMKAGENTFIVVAGGFNLWSLISQKILDSVEIYNTNDNTWHSGKRRSSMHFLIGVVLEIERGP